MLIRPALLGDYTDISKFDEFIGDRRLDLQTGDLRVACDEHGAVTGYLRISPSGFLGWPLLAGICIDTAHRRQGVAAALLEDVVSEPRWPRLYVTTEEGNRPMLSLLEKVGATAIGHVDQLNMSEARELLFRLK